MKLKKMFIIFLTVGLTLCTFISLDPTSIFAATATNAPTVNPLYDTDTKIEGKTEPNSEVNVNFEISNELIATGNSDAKGNFSLAINKLKANTSIYVYAVAPGKSVSSPTKIIVDSLIQGTSTTKGDITFKQDDSKVDPVDPDDPDNPVDPIDPDHPDGPDGPLSINYISNFHFGEQIISAKSETYYAELDELKLKDGSVVKRPNYIQVTDKRGTNGGWRLQVQQGNQFSATTSNGEKELKGAQLTLSNPYVVTNSDNNSEAPTAADKIVLVPGSKGSDGEVIPGAAQDVLVAQKEQGMGTWVEKFGNGAAAEKSISLSVPVSAEKAKDATYTTEMTWILLDTPA
ncbi:WxL domain-containing protein [Listeria sp. PSOL-1]|uniref:WxL domain-containing protein n=1 Tax=Listeria sp. PSOL-1 TaxID=1844999 RepID=UPI0013D40C2E|nr:WxL domain-containing protein [Listeria sp. PSOL-1]